jgi:hypothetical protein
MKGSQFLREPVIDFIDAMAATGQSPLTSDSIASIIGPTTIVGQFWTTLPARSFAPPHY